MKIPITFIETGLFSFQQTIYLIFSFVFFMVIVWSLDLNDRVHPIDKGEASVKKKVTITNQSSSETRSNSSRTESVVKENVTFSSQVDPETRKRAIAFAGYDKERIERLLNSARLKNPNRSEQWYWEKILYDLQRERGF